MNFIDRATIYLSSGNGGDGCLSFHRAKNKAMGGPDGGDGGHGGNVLLRCDPNFATLADFRYRQHFRAKNGTPGSSKMKTGKRGNDLVLTLPEGTRVYDATSEALLADLTGKSSLLLLRGGNGGFGNARFKTSSNQAPRRTNPGQDGQALKVVLQLALLAQVGLLGLPNAGKSSFLNSCTNAKSKIADYPFTTLTPQLGIAELDFQELIIADIPGIVEGAHEGAGLGTRFLTHLERCKILLHLIDVTAPSIAENYRVARAELNKHSEDLSSKPEIVALSKSDLLNEDELAQRIQDFRSEIANDPLAPNASPPAVISLSSLTKSGTRECIALALEKVREQEKESDDQRTPDKAWSPLES